MISRAISLCCLLLAVWAAPAVARASSPPAGDELPPWIQQAASAVVPTYPKDVPAVVLHHEQTMSVSPDGRVTTTKTHVVRLLLREGRDYAAASELYLTDSSKVRELKAWLLRPGGQIKRYGKDETADLAAEPNDIYNEYRIKAISARDDAEAGAIFGYQSIVEERALTSQETWFFQGALPTLLSRYTLALPTGWRATDVTFNHPKVMPQVTGSNYTWELRNLPPIEWEPMSPKWTNVAPRLAVSYFPPDAAQAASFKSFANWADVSRWMTELTDAQADSNDALATRAMQLTQGAKTELEKIQAIARYVQSLQYISIDLNVGRGGGYRPRLATQVFAKNYGDCKDKANLMRAMLKVVGIESYLVGIYSGDPGYVREEWATTGQFNHCIIAVKVGDETQAATIVQHAALGRLLIFDATDEHTPVGDLPDHEQGSLALIVAGDKGSLMRMPVTSPEANQLDRLAEVSLDQDGTIKATLRESSVGQSSVQERRLFRQLPRPEYAKLIERWITSGATGAQVSKVEPADNQSDGRFALDVEFTAQRYGQLMQNRLLVFKPAIVSRRESLSLVAPTRRHPVVIESQAYTETVKVSLPAGFDVDELPDAVKLDAAFGSYAALYEVKEGRLHFTRSLKLKATTIPPDQYQTVRGFFERIRAAEQAPVVLARSK
ncbi:MAG: DUF3857 domain-containing protein [Pyrinomonadaceae bacterium]